jgi:glycosyltransferase involved in cell wall biosynthesis
MPLRDRLRVALVSFGFGEYSTGLASGLAPQAEVLLVIPDELVRPHLNRLNENVRLFSFPSARLRQPLRQLRIIRAIFRKIREFAPDVIHYQGTHLWFDLAFPLLRRFPLVLTIHDFHQHPGDRLSQKTPFWIEMFARRHADALIVHTQHVRALALRRLRTHAGSVTVIPHIQIGEQSSIPANAEDEGLILFFGRIWEYKGLEYLIRAEPLISARVPVARILIAGEGEDFSRYARMMVHPERFIVDNNYISEERCAEYFRRASVVVLPYIEASQSGVIPLAYSAAKPVVASNVGGLPEMVEHGGTGYLVAPRNVNELADAICRLLLDAPLRRRLGANGKRKIEAESSPRAIAQRTIDVYRRAILGRARVPEAAPVLGSAAAKARADQKCAHSND